MEDKKLVAEWMEWKIDCEVFRRTHHEKWEHLEFDWNPQDNDKATFKEWEEIYHNMNEKDFKAFKKISLRRLSGFQEKEERELFYITLQPDIRWWTLIRMIKEGKA